MATPEYRYIAADLMTGAIKEQMQFTGTKFVESIRGSEEFDAALDLGDRNATRAVLNPEGTLVVVERDGQVAWSGIYWDPARQDRNTLGVHANGIAYYLEHIFVEQARVYTATDLATIVNDLMNDIAGKPDILPIVTPVLGLTGSTRRIAFLPEDQDSVVAALDRLGGTTGGFDWSLEAAWIGNPRMAQYQFGFHFPSRGTDTTWVLEYEANVADYEMPVMGSRRATDVTIVGQGSGQSSRRAIASDHAIKPRMEVARKVSGDTDQSGLDQMAEAVLAARKKEVTTMTLYMTPGTEPGYTEIAPGDRARLKIRDGYFQFDGAVRVTRKTVVPGDVEAVSLDVVDESAVSD